MKQIVFATNNSHKVEEVRNKLNGLFEIRTLSEIDCTDDIPETSDTLQGNAGQKSHYLFDRFHCDCFADDTGLEVEALNGAPGVYSARYAGPAKDSEANIDKLLAELEGKTNRRAKFRTVISLILDGKEHLFEGSVTGTILTERHGSQGFGYDPVFQPDGFDRSFAELSMEEKNKISHRGKATEKLICFLNDYK